MCIRDSTYLALKLSSSVVFMQPNVAAMGKIDLDDTDHVVASANPVSYTHLDVYKRQKRKIREDAEMKD